MQGPGIGFGPAEPQLRDRTGASVWGRKRSRSRSEIRGKLFSPSKRVVGCDPSHSHRPTLAGLKPVVFSEANIARFQKWARKFRSACERFTVRLSKVALGAKKRLFYKTKKNRTPLARGPVMS